MKRLLCMALALLMALSQIGVVYAEGPKLSEDDVESIVFERTFYNETPTTGSSSCTASGQATDGALPAGVPAAIGSIISAAANKHNTNASLLAALAYWENRGFPDPKRTDWPSSPKGAKGPMQFMDGTWEAYKVDGNNDGKTDVMNIYDAIYGAAKMISANGVKPATELGTLEKPGKNGTLLRAAANYNLGSGGVDERGGEDTTLERLPKETSDYLKAIYTLISSGFTSLPMSSGGTKPPAGTAGETSTNVAETCSGASDNPIGTGTGKFSDGNTKQFTGVEAAMAKAKQIAAAGPKLWGEVCDGSPNCYGRCERLASVIWGRTSSGYATAMVHWNSAKAAGRAHPGDRSPPLGAVLYYDTGKPEGHVATYLGKNMIISNDVNDSKSGIKGGVYIVPASAMEGSGWDLTYLGWVDPVPWI